MLLSFTVATLVGVTVAQPTAGCSNELLALYRAGGVATPEACELLRHFEACVSKVGDASDRSALEVDLNQQQQQYAACTNVGPLTASIRTSRDAIDFSGRDFVFHRTTRQSCNLFELRDLVTGFTQNISNTVSSIEAVQTSIGTVEGNVAAFQQNVSVRLAALELRIDQALNAADTPCIPYVEFTSPSGACLQLNRTCDAYTPPHYERVRPTRTSDRQCALVSMCTATQWEAIAPNSFTDRGCRAVTNCTATGQYTSQAATPTADAICVNLPGLTQSSPIRGACNVLRVGQSNTPPSGFYWLEIAGQIRQTYCDMTYDGGGWTMVGRGIGGAASCWGNSGDCNPHFSAAAYAWNTGPTWKTSDTRINQMTYSTIRLQGIGIVTGNQFWVGKDNAGRSGCTYRHRVDSAGACNCATLNADMTSLRCGRGHGGHQGVGDWPNPSGGLHSMHTGNFWYFKKNAHHGGHMNPNGYCHGNNRRCNIALWIR